MAGYSACRVPELRGDGDPDEDQACPICLSGLSCAAVFRLPVCGHEFHALCLASTLHQSMLCPICRTPVDAHVCRDVAAVLVADTRGNATQSAFSPAVAAGVNMDLRSRDENYTNQGPAAGGASAKAIVESLREVAGDRDGHRIPFVASLLGRGNNGPTRAWHPPEVRCAAVDALRAVIPKARFNEEMSSMALGVELLKELLIASEEEENVRTAALGALREVCVAGDSRIICTLQRVLEDTRSGERLRRAVADALQALTLRGDVTSMRAAMVALQDPDPQSGVRSIGVGILRQICIRGECTELVQDLTALVAGHDDLEVRKAALELIGQTEEYGGACGTSCAISMLGDRNAELRQAALGALRILWRRGDRRGVATLTGLISSRNDVELCRSALDVLSEVAEHNHPGTVSATVAAISDRDESIRAAAVRTLRQIASKGNESAVRPCVALLGHRDEDVRRSALEALSSLALRDDVETISAIRCACNTEDDMTKLAAQQALRQIG